MTVLGWRRRDVPLAPAAVVGHGAVVGELAARVAADPDTAARLRAVAGTGWLVVLGTATDLPWVDGIRFLGWDHGLLLPTTHTPTIQVELVARQLRHHHRAELTVLLPDALLTSDLPAAPVDVARLGAIR